MIERKFEKRNVFNKMICDMCGRESDETYWYEKDMAHIGIYTTVRKSENVVAYEPEELDRTEYDLCPECFDKITKMIKEE